MIGNDVIDLVQSRKESNWRRPGLIPKLFDVNEQLLIANSEDPEIAIWVLWSMKEAAYKIWHRYTRVRKYIPKKLVCSLATQCNNSAAGEVTCGRRTFYTTTQLSQGIIHTVAVDNLGNLNHVAEIERDRIFKDYYGIPYIIIEGQQDVSPASVSNHGRIEKAVAILKPNLHFF
ncbi:MULTISPECIES: 4'-phosphopantetheinyl transferase family protein [unclassified Sphingobacterium]|uniref:4'-phosphopantetheinyl transferase family protein n=1 Tax=unclassified Sphingobacterium TaxID=2609468 RepID=UPI0025F4D384|nr:MULTISPECIES: 4'-phosphopantetheinyl transferase superfamily protein [unclassified Sphingobacterium]